DRRPGHPDQRFILLGRNHTAHRLLAHIGHGRHFLSPALPSGNRLTLRIWRLPDSPRAAVLSLAAWHLAGDARPQAANISTLLLCAIRLQSSVYAGGIA